MKCCNCGREYDPDSIIDSWYINKKGQKSNVLRVAIDGQILAFCKYCVRAATFGASAIAVEGNIKNLSEVGIDFSFEKEMEMDKKLGEVGMKTEKDEWIDARCPWYLGRWKVRDNCDKTCPITAENRDTFICQECYDDDFD